MYNGIGLSTARGSGTNGYVQKNFAFLKNVRDKVLVFYHYLSVASLYIATKLLDQVDYKSEEELKKLDASISKGPNKDILAHERKRKVELKCMEMQELMEEQGFGMLVLDFKRHLYESSIVQFIIRIGTRQKKSKQKSQPLERCSWQKKECRTNLLTLTRRAAQCKSLYILNCVH